LTRVGPLGIVATTELARDRARRLPHVRSEAVLSVADQVSWVGLVLASGLLVVSGALKVRHPESAQPLLALLHVPLWLQRGRALGLLELCVGFGAVMTAAQPFIVAEAAAFGFFALVIGYVLAARIPLTSCGCAGTRQTPPSILHVGVDVAAAGAAAFAAVSRPGSLAAMWPRLELLGIPTIVGIVTAICLLMAAMGPLADLLQNCTRIRAAGLVYHHPQGSEIAS
jgi:hypothetical protein